MFRAKVKSEVLKEVVGVVSALVDEVKFVVNKEGISLRAVDPAHVAMVDLKLKKDSFQEYDASQSEIGIDLDKLKDVLKLAKSDDIISMNLDEDKNKLVIQVEKVTRRTALMDMAGMSEPKIPNLNMPVKLTINANELMQGIKASESVGDHIIVSVSPEGLELSSEGETDSVNLKVPKEMLYALECKEPVKSMFSLDFFSNMVKSIGSADKVNLFVGKDYPIRMEFDIAGGHGHVKYLLAPRIENG